MLMRDELGVVCTVIYGPDQRTAITPATRSALYVTYVPPGVPTETVSAHRETIKANCPPLRPPGGGGPAGYPPRLLMSIRGAQRREIPIKPLYVIFAAGIPRTCGLGATVIKVKAKEVCSSRRGPPGFAIFDHSVDKDQ